MRAAWSSPDRFRVDREPCHFRRVAGQAGDRGGHRPQQAARTDVCGVEARRCSLGKFDVVEASEHHRHVTQAGHAGGPSGGVVATVARGEPRILPVELGVATDHRSRACQRAADAVGVARGVVIRPLQRGEHVGQRRVGRPEIEVVVAASERLAPVGEPCRVPLAHLDELSSVAQPVERELADRLQQPVPAVGIVEQHEALVDKSTDHIEHRVATSPSLRRRSPPRPRRVGSHPGTPPGDASTARSMSSSRSTLQAIEASNVCWRGIAVRAPPDSSRNAWSSPRAKRVEWHRAHSRRGQLHRQRDPVEPGAHRGDQRRALVVDDEVRSRPVRPIEEQPRRLVRVRPLHRRRLVARRDAQRRHPPHELTVDAERLAAGHQQPHVRALRHQRVDELGHRVDEVLGVVDHQQRRAPIAEMTRPPLPPSQLRETPPCRPPRQPDRRPPPPSSPARDPPTTFHRGGRRPARRRRATRGVSCRTRPIRSASPPARRAPAAPRRPAPAHAR